MFGQNESMNVIIVIQSNPKYQTVDYHCASNSKTWEGCDVKRQRFYHEESVVSNQSAKIAVKFIR